MDCPSVLARLADLASGDLPPQEGAELSAHLKGCPACRAEWEKLNAGLLRMREFYAHFDPDAAPAPAAAPAETAATRPATRPATGPAGPSRRPARVPEPPTLAAGPGQPSPWENLFESILSGWRGPALAFSLLLVAGILLLGRGRLPPGPGPRPGGTDGLPVLAQGAARLTAGQALVKPGEPLTVDAEYLILEPATVETPTGGRVQVDPGSRLAFAGNGVVRLAAGVLRVAIDAGAPGWRVETPTATVTTPDRAGFTLWVAADHTLAHGEAGGLSLRGAAGTILLKQQEWGLAGRVRPPQALPPGIVAAPPPTGGKAISALGGWLAGLEAAALAAPAAAAPATLLPTRASETVVAPETASPTILPADHAPPALNADPATAANTAPATLPGSVVSPGSPAPADAAATPSSHATVGLSGTSWPPATASPAQPPAVTATDGQPEDPVSGPVTGSATLPAPGEVFDQAP
ncbi:MAG: zf-HC2 domain-containing protein [Candidatus Riflebacteria bacterium]|nr:zf-HC2 domain-containing protein [Candidatus Riflebacteria bacterium]